MQPDLARDGVAKGPPRGPPRGQSVWSSIGTQSRGQQPQGEGLGSLTEALDRILCKGVAVDGALVIGVAGVDLVRLDLRLLLAAVDIVGHDEPFFSSCSAPPPLPPPPPPVITPSPPQRLTGPFNRSAEGTPVSGGDTAIAASGSDSLSQIQAAVSPGDALAGRKGPEQGLVKLVLTLVNLLHEVLERQAVRRMGNGTLTPAEIERIGTALYAQTLEIARLREQFGLSEADLTLRLSAAN
jgi:hypothetical protein